MKKSLRKVLSLCLAALMLMSLLAGCGTGNNGTENNTAGNGGNNASTNDQTTQDPVENDSTTLTIAINADMQTTDPQALNNGTTTSILYNVYSNLVKQDDAGELYMDLAESYELLEDQVTWRFKIREDAVFQDGSPVTAADVAYSLNRVMNDETSFDYTNFTPLKEAGVEHADMVIAATSEDETNMVCCLTAKRLGAGYAIARVRNMEYTTDLETLKKELGIDMVINPELATALEISRLLRFPNAANIDTFYRGRVELMGFLLQEGDFLCHRPLSEQSAKLKNLPVLFCAAERDGEVHIPNGSFVPLPGDKLYIIGEPVGLSQFFRLLGRYIPKIKSVFLIGGGRITYYLTTLLTKMNLPVKIVEQKMERCRQLSELCPHATIIHGDGTDQDLLEVENLASSDAFIALTDRDEDNLITALYAKHLGVPKVIPKANRQNYTGIAQSVGLDCVVSPKYITAERILQIVRGMENSKGSIMKALYRIASNQAETMEFTVNETTQFV